MLLFHRGIGSEHFHLSHVNVSVMLSMAGGQPEIGPEGQAVFEGETHLVFLV